MKPAAPSLPDVSILHPVRVIATAFNLLTRQQPWAAERLTRHAGKTLRVALGAFHVTLTVGHDGHLSQADPAIVPDVTLDIVPERLSVSRILSMRQGGDFSDLIQVSGEASLAQVVSELARDLRPDPEDFLAGWIGDIPASRIPFRGSRRPGWQTRDGRPGVWKRRNARANRGGRPPAHRAGCPYRST